MIEFIVSTINERVTYVKLIDINKINRQYDTIIVNWNVQNIYEETIDVLYMTKNYVQLLLLV